MPVALSVLYATQQDVEALLSAEGVELRLDDDGTGTVNATELAYLTVQALSYGTDRVNYYCLPRYSDPAELAKSWIVNEWATVCAGRWLCSRRTNPLPESIEKLFAGAVEEMKAVQAGAAQVPGIGLGDAAWPVWDNLNVDPRYRVRKARVERRLSEKRPDGRRQYTDHFVDVLGPEW